jgi:hypothetical protein
MKRRFHKHYTREEARALLPQIRDWLRELADRRERLAQHDQAVAHLMKSGEDRGGATVNNCLRELAAIKAILREFDTREIQIKDLDRGLIDFPALREGREVFLCWELGENDIEYWHDLDTGYAGREPL